MKRILSIILVAMLFFNLSPAFAGGDKDALADAGVFSGSTPGSQMILKQDMAVYVTRMLGKELEAKRVQILPAFYDVEDPSYRPYIAWMVMNEYISGETDFLYGYNQITTVQELCAVWLRVLDYWPAWDNVMMMARDVGLLEGVVASASTQVSIDLFSEISCNAMSTPMKNHDVSIGATSSSSLARTSFTYATANSARQIGEKTVRVAFTKPTYTGFEIQETESYAKKIKRITWDESHSVATIEVTTAFEDQDYTLVAGDLTLAFTGQEAVVSEIYLNSNTFAKVNDYMAETYYTVLNQFGEEVRFPNMYWAVSIDANVGATMDKLVITSSEVLDEDIQFTLYGANADSGAEIQKLVRVSDAGTGVNYMKFGDLTNASESAMDYKINYGDVGDNYEWRVPVYVYDEFGNVIPKSQFYRYDVDFSVTMGEDTIQYGLFAGDPVPYVRIKPTDTDAPTTDIRLQLSAGSMTKSYLFTITGKAALDRFEFFAPEDILVENEEIEIPYTAYDTRGNRIDQYDDLINANIVFVNDEAFKWRREPVTGRAQLFYTPEMTRYEMARYNGQLVSARMVVDPEPEPEMIGGLDDKVLLAMITGHSITIEDGDFVYYDEYGREIAATSDYLNGYPTRVEIDGPDQGYVSLDDATGDYVFTGEEEGEEEFRAYLYDIEEGDELSGSDFEFTVAAFDLESIETFTVELDALIYGGDEDGLDLDDYKRTVEVNGTIDGYTLEIPGSVVTVKTPSPHITNVGDTIEGNISDDDDVTYEDEIVLVSVNNGEALYNFEIPVSISNEAPEMVRIDTDENPETELVDDDSSFEPSRNLVVVDYGSEDFDAFLKDGSLLDTPVRFEVIDQYNTTNGISPLYYTLTVEKAEGSTATYTIDNAEGVLSYTGTPADGDLLTIKAMGLGDVEGTMIIAITDLD